MTDTITAYRSDLAVGPAGFPQLLQAEWTKFRTVRGWVVGLMCATVVTIAVGLLTITGGPSGCGGQAGCSLPVGPGGEPVIDSGTFVYQPLDGDGSISVRVTSLTGLLPADGFADADPAAANAPAVRTGQAPPPGMRSGLVPWAKAGILIKASTKAGSAYAAIMTTGSHGVRMQHNYTQDTAGSPGSVTEAAPRWLRLTRSGNLLTGYESPDGIKWSTVGTARLEGLTQTVQAGLFAASPEYGVTNQSLGGLDSISGPSEARAEFDNLALAGNRAGAAWAGTGELETGGAKFSQSAAGYSVAGSGDIGPAVAGPGANTLEQGLVGVFAGLIFVIVIGASFITAEYRRGMIRTTLAANPRRGRVLAAKAVVIFSVTFVAGLVASVAASEVVGRIRGDNGDMIFPVTSLTRLRVLVGTAALLAVAAVLALAVGMALRRSAGAVAAVIVLVVLPYILAAASVLPTDPANWLLRVTPAAAFAIQQTGPRYAHVDSAYLPATGYYPLAPLAGFAVLCAWTALALVWAYRVQRRRDA